MTATEKLWELYQEHKSVWRVADIVGLCGQSVHERLQKAGYKLKGAKWTLEETQKLIDYYTKTNPDDFDIHELATLLKRPYYGIAMKASRLGVGRIDRKKNTTTRKKMAVRSKKWHEENDHPRGALGIKHNKETRRKLSEASIRAHKNRPPERETFRIEKQLKTKAKRGNLIPPRHKASWKQSWQTIGGKRNYYRSSWEVNYAHYLEWLKINKEIIEWEHEPTTFWFEGIKRGVRSYTPDFLVTENNNKEIYHEIKGWMDARSKTKIKRMAKYHPDISLLVIDAKAYKKLNKQLSGLVTGWK